MHVKLQEIELFAQSEIYVNFERIPGLVNLRRTFSKNP